MLVKGAPGGNTSSYKANYFYSWCTHRLLLSQLKSSEYSDPHLGLSSKSPATFPPELCVSPPQLWVLFIKWDRSAIYIRNFHLDSRPIFCFLNYIIFHVIKGIKNGCPCIVEIGGWGWGVQANLFLELIDNKPLYRHWKLSVHWPQAEEQALKTLGCTASFMRGILY